MTELTPDFQLENDGRRDQPILAWLLIVLSSVLLGIWAVKGTIALRNSLLGLETVLSFFYCLNFFRFNKEKIPFVNWLPLILLGCMFFWVIIHYFFLSRFPEQQFHELTSTWLRAGLAVIVGFGTGLAITQRPNAITFLWLGILGGFLFLLYQYVPKAIALKSLYAPDYLNYIYFGKISGALAGTILLVGLLDAVMKAAERPISFKVMNFWFIWFIGTAIVLYAYVFIFDTRNGIGVAVLIYMIVFLILFWRLIKALCFGKGVIKHIFIFILFLGCSLGLLGYFGVEHLAHNSGWLSFWEDLKVSVQIKKYPNWQNYEVLGFPMNSSGQTVMHNTYVRVAWAVAGFSVLLPSAGLGVGLLDGSFPVLMKDNFLNSGYIPSSHSGWTDLGMAFGYPGLCLMISSMAAVILIASFSTSCFKRLGVLLALSLTLLYAVGELGSQHAIEVLYYLIALLTSLLFPLRSFDQILRSCE